MHDESDAPRVLDLAGRLAADHLATVPHRRVAGPVDVAALQGAIDPGLPQHPSPPADVLAALADAVSAGLVTSNGPRYFGFVVGGTLPVAVGAEWLNAAWDQNTALNVMSPAMAVVEEVAGSWLVDLLGLPPDVSFGFVSGATMANWTALAAARHEVLARAGWDVERKGLFGAPPITVLVGAERHTTIDLVCRYLGLGTDQIVPVAADGQGRMDPAALAAALRGFSGPAVVCAQAGNVNSGAVDDIVAICEAAATAAAWVHVDGAVGAWLATVPGRRDALAGWDRADSWATDAHKGLNVAYDCGVVFCAHEQAHRAACAAVAPYLQTVPGAREGSHWVPESSRRARALGVYAVLRQLGRDGVAELTDRMCRMAALFAERLAAVPGAEVLNEVTANQVLVRFGGSDEVTAAVVADIQRGGVCWMGSTQWHGELAMRISVCNWATSPHDVDLSVAAIRAALAAVPG